MKNRFLIFTALLCATVAQAQNAPKPAGAGPLPTPAQLAWHEAEYYWFIHFGPNTFTNKEWGHGDETEDIFNPTQLDCRQWARLAKAAGAKGIIITAKHHDGFCLWPSKYSAHTVKQSKWKGGKGDVLRDLSDACKAYGLKFGVYLSPWDRNHPKYGTPEYNDVYVNTMTEIFTNYGPIWEFWWDGANGEGPNGKKQEYDWERFRNTVKKLSPNTVVFSDVGPHIRWVGNEKGIAGTTNWNLLDVDGYTAGAGAPKQEILTTGNENGARWIPAECDVSIRPGWFYHAEEDSKVKTPEELFQLYLKSVGRGSNLLLNIPPDRRGLIHSADSAALMGFKKLRDDNLNLNRLLKMRAFFMSGRAEKATLKLTDNNRDTYETLSMSSGAVVTLSFKNPIRMNAVKLREYLAAGQRVKKFKLTLSNANGSIVKEIDGTTIGRKRILSFPAFEVANIKLEISEAKADPLLSEIAAYLMQDNLIEK